MLTMLSSKWLRIQRHPETEAVSSYNNLAYLYSSMGRYEDAIAQKPDI
jgi:hypothetical protein